MISNKDKIHEVYLQKLKNLNVEGFESFETERLLYNESYYVIEKSWWKVLKRFFYNFIFKDEFLVEYERSDLLVFSVWYKRKDHDENWRNFLGLPIKKQQIFFERKNILGNFKQYYFYLKKVKSYLKTLNKIDDKKNRLYLAIKFYELSIFKEWLEKNVDGKYKAACVFFDSGFYENLFVQYMKKKKVLTLTLQHGQPVFRSWNYDRMNQSIILNFTSDIGICAGEFSRQQYLKAGYEERRLYICGSLKNINKIEKIDKIDKEKIVFCIFLDAPFMSGAEIHNKILIEIGREFAKNNNIFFGIKKHPLDKNGYKTLKEDKRCCFIYGKECGLDEVCEKVSFGLFHASAIYVDMIERNIKPFKLKTEYYMPITSENEEFSNLAELNRLYFRWQKSSEKVKKIYFIDKKRYYINAENAVEEHIRLFEQILK